MKAPAVVLIAAFVLLGAALPVLGANGFLLTVGTMVALNIIGATSLHLVIRTGHVSLAHAGFMGIGGYTATLTLMKLGWAFPLNILAGAAAPALLALLIGPVLLRLQGKYFVLVTFLLGEILRLVFVQWSSLTGGANGIFGVPPPDLRRSPAGPDLRRSRRFLLAGVRLGAAMRGAGRARAERRDGPRDRQRP
jgi:branched-chain amino acid transport system permease protein